MADLEVCRNCGAKLKSGMFGVNAALDERRLKTINHFSESPLPGACNSCGLRLEENFPNYAAG